MFNPLLIKEIRTRMRGKTVFLIENIYLAIFIGLVLIFIKDMDSEHQNAWDAGAMLFMITVMMQAALLSVITPAIVASSITMEREQKTYDMLLTTPLKPWQIIVNKLVASTSYFIILLFLSIPVISIAFILGGVTSKQVFLSFAVTFDVLLLAGMLGMLCSAVFNRSITAVPVSMIVTLVMFGLLNAASEIFPAVSMLSPFTSIERITTNWNIGFYALQVPFWAPHFILAALLFATIFFATVERIKDERHRNMIPARVSLYLVITSLFIFSAGSMNFFIENIEYIREEIEKLCLLCFMLCVFLAFMIGGAPISRRDLEEIRKTRKGLNALFNRFFGGTFSSAVGFIALVSITGGLITALSLYKFSILENRAETGIMIGLVLFSLSLMVSLFAKMLRGSANIKSMPMPPIVGAVLVLVLVFAPQQISSRAHNKAGVPINPVDVVMFASPAFAVKAAIDPDNSAGKYPYCKSYSHPFHMPVVTALFYLLFSCIFALVGMRQENRMRKFSRVELFYLKQPDLEE